jgi:peptidoglycan/xylan/chitin deacetylase (PgdA/CDA1 family)
MIRAARGGAAVILTYHRIADVDIDPQRLAIPPSRFAEHVAALRERYTLMSAGSVFSLLAEGRKLPRNAVAITLDDGYADALSNALPILQVHDAPATVFVCSGFLGEIREFWWDELERVVLLTPELPERLDIESGEFEFRRSVDAAQHMLPEARELLSGWDFTKPVTHPRQQLYLDLAAAVEPLSSSRREEVLAQLRGQTGAPATVRAEKRTLARSDLVELEASGLVEIGAHTINHARLGSLSLNEQREEIVGSKRALEAACGHVIGSFSYPYGTHGAFNAETVELVREAGFIGACTTQLGSPLPWGAASMGTDRFRVPRTATADITAGELVLRIDKYLGI